MGYAQLADLYRFGAPATAFGNISTGDQQAALDEASGRVDEFLAARYPLPLISWPTSITEYTCRIATWNLLSARGYNPTMGGDSNIKDRYDNAIEMLTLVQKQQLHPAVVPQPNQAPTYEQPAVYTFSAVDMGTGAIDNDRGW